MSVFPESLKTLSNEPGPIVNVTCPSCLGRHAQSRALPAGIFHSVVYICQGRKCEIFFDSVGLYGEGKWETVNAALNAVHTNAA